jgi:phosphopantothenoylcysteine decarboxylase/phosphopantothenate--cysteine ligase
MAHLQEATIIVKAAAVADYRVPEPARQKIKKSGAGLTLALEPTPDILAELGPKKGTRLLAGFAAETGDPTEEAQRKLASKSCDMIVGNRVDRDGVGMGSDDNEVVLAMRTGETVALPRAPKREIADRIFDYLLKLRDAS